MRNYLRRLELTRKAHSSEIESAINASMENTVDVQSVADAESILGDNIVRTYYERTHVQYEAIAAAIDCLDSPIAKDTQEWGARVVEFEDEDDDNDNDDDEDLD